jgi:hypothetical protein
VRDRFVLLPEEQHQHQQLEEDQQRPEQRQELETSVEKPKQGEQQLEHAEEQLDSEEQQQLLQQQEHKSQSNNFAAKATSATSLLVADDTKSSICSNSKNSSSSSNSNVSSTTLVPKELAVLNYSSHAWERLVAIRDKLSYLARVDFSLQAAQLNPVYRRGFNRKKIESDIRLVSNLLEKAVKLDKRIHRNQVLH